MMAEIVATLKYQELSGLIGRSLHLSSPESAPDEVLAQCRDVLPPSAQFHHPALEQRQLTISRRGLLDLQYRIDPSELDNFAPGGLPLLQQLGWSSDRDPDWEDDDAADDFDLGLTGLTMLHEQVTAGYAYALLFLQTWEQLTPAEREYRRINGLPPDFFVTTYRITDACLTNAKSVWLFKRFY